MEEFDYRATLKAFALSMFLSSLLKCNWGKSHKGAQKVPWLLSQKRWIQGEDLKRARVPYSQPLFYFIYLTYIIYIKGSAGLTSNICLYKQLIKFNIEWKTKILNREREISEEKIINKIGKTDGSIN